MEEFVERVKAGPKQFDTNTIIMSNYKRLETKDRQKFLNPDPFNSAEWFIVIEEVKSAKTHLITVNTNQTIEELKKVLSNKYQIEPLARLIVNGKILNDNEMISNSDLYKSILKIF